MSLKGRRYCPLIDDSAIESDGGGGDILSCNSSRACSPTATEAELDALIPKRSNFPEKSSQPPTTVTEELPLRLRLLRSKPFPVITKKSEKPIVKPVSCDLCYLELSGPKQLSQHRGKKKCRSRADIISLSSCDICYRFFDTTTIRISTLRRSISKALIQCN